MRDYADCGTLRASSAHWHENACDMRPFVGYVLGIIHNAYRELESRVRGVVAVRMTKAERIRAAVDSTLGRVTKRDILARCPDVSVSMVEMTLKTLLDEDAIRKVGNGRAAAYVRCDGSGAVFRSPMAKCERFCHAFGMRGWVRGTSPCR